MQQLDTLNLARSCGQTVSSDFAQVITITFAMVVATYYFLHQAGFRMKLFAFTIYTCGILAYLGMMFKELAVAFGAEQILRAIPEPALEASTKLYLAMQSSWVGTASNLLLIIVYWVLWLGTGYLLFFWRKPQEIAPLRR